VTTPTSRYALSKIVEATDNVDVVADFNNNWDAIDLKLGSQVCTSSTRPASPVQGMQIFETDTGFTRVYKGAAWQTAGGAVGTSTSLPANPIQGDTVYLTDWSTTAYYSGTAWHYADIVQATSTSRPAGSALQIGSAIFETDTKRFMVWNGSGWENKSGAYTCTSTTRPGTAGQGFLIYETDTSRVLLYNGASWIVIAGVLSVVTTTTTIANTAALSTLQTVTIPANEPIAGSVYELYGSGMFSVTGTPTLQFSLYWGGIAGTNLVTFATFGATSGIAGASFDYHVRLSFRSTTSVVAMMRNILNTNSASNSSAAYTVTTVPTAVTTSSSNALAVGFQWSAASASNTISLLSGYVDQIA
jgi:hypothetical protein